MARTFDDGWVSRMPVGDVLNFEWAGGGDVGGAVVCVAAVCGRRKAITVTRAEPGLGKPWSELVRIRCQANLL